MAERTYRFLRSTNGSDPVFGDEPMTKADAFALLGVEHMLHVLASWQTKVCRCGQGFHAIKGDVHRQVHIVEDDVTAAAVAMLAESAESAESAERELVTA